MDTKEQVTATKKEIEKCIAYLMNSLKERLSEKRVRTYKDEEGNIKNREDFRYDFEMQFDELPYFSLYVNLKKAVYEKLLVPCHKANALNENDMEDLAKVGVTEEKGELKFKSLKDFVPKSKYLYCMDIDLGALEEYLDEIEVSLLYSIHSNPVLAILNNLFDGESLVQNQIGADGVLPKSALDEEGYLQRLFDY